MDITVLEKSDAVKAAALFNRYAESELVYKKLSDSDFTAQFITDDANVIKINLAAKAEDGSLVGFANVCIKRGVDIGYITFILVDAPYRRQGIARKLLTELETALDLAAPLSKYQIMFFNPIALTWIVPGTPGHDHPNAPGIDVASDAYLFFKNNGYLDNVFQNSFYLPLANFQIKPDVQARIDALSQHALSICFYDPKKHFGMKELFDDLGSEDWKEIVLGNIAREDGGDPVIIAEHNGKAVGFTGPIYVQKSGRGYFAGIGVHSEYRKYGLGKALFSTLCQSLKNIGAGYMTLYTGETNPARYIYQAAGFKIVKTWSDMEKVIKK